MNLDEARRLAPPASKEIEWIVKGRGFSTGDIISVLMKADREAAQFDYSVLARKFENPNALVMLRNIYDFVKFEIQYVADEVFREICRLPHTLIATGRGDCKSMALFVGSMLRSLGIKFIYRFAAYDKKDYQHVYVVAYIEDRDGLKAIVIDPVPGGSFITETKFQKSTDRMPDGVGIMRGIEEDAPIGFDYDQWTDGIFTAQLVKASAKDLIKYHPDSPKVKEWKKGIDMIDNALYSGLHGRNPKIAGSGYFREVIERAKNRSQPACRDFFTADPKKIGDPLIPIEDWSACERLRNAQSGGNGGYWDTVSNKWVNGVPGGGMAAYDACINEYSRNAPQREMKQMLNENLEKFAARYLYHFCDGSELLDNSGYSFECKTKMTEHRRLFDDLVSITKLSATNMNLWSELGIGRQTAAKGFGVRKASDMIQGFKDHPSEGLYNLDGSPHIGEPITLAILIGYAVIVAISGTVAVAIIQACHGKEPTALSYAPKILAAGWGSQGKDFEKKNGNSGNNGDTDKKTPIPPAKPSFFAQNKKPLLIGTGVLAAGGLAAFIMTHDSN